MTTPPLICQQIVDGDLRAILKTLLTDAEMVHGRCVFPGDSEELSPLHFAADSGDVALAGLLLHFAANVNSRAGELIEEEDGWEEWDSGITPLMLAAWRGHAEVVTLLLRFHADVDLGDRYDFTPLHAATNGGHPNVVRLLLQSGASVHATYGRQTHDLEFGTELRLTALHLAAKSGDKEICRLLLEHGADPNQPDFLGQVPLHYAARRSNSEVVKLLLEAGARMDVCRCNAGADPFDGTPGYTPLHYAAEGPLDSGGSPQRSQFDRLTIELLCESSGDLDVVNEHGQTPLHLAVNGGWIESVATLLKYGADPNARSNFGVTPLHHAADVCSSSTRVGMAALLLAYGADAESRDDDGESLLDVARNASDEALVDFLVSWESKRASN